MVSQPDIPAELKLPRLSHSQLTSYANCSEQYRLIRRHHLPDSTSWALVGGSTFHAWSECWDQGIPVDPAYFKSLLDDQVRATLESDRSDAKSESDIRPTGRASKEWPDKRDRKWWEHHGPIFAQQYIDWRQSEDNELMPTAAVPGEDFLVEYKVEGRLGGVDVLGFIDRLVLDCPAGEAYIMDIKTGAAPKNALQLATYAVLAEEQLGIKITKGIFYLAEKGELSYVHNLANYNREYIESLYEQARRGIAAGVFLPNPNAYCDSCPVKKFCGLYGNRPPLDAKVPLLEPVIQ